MAPASSSPKPLVAVTCCLRTPGVQPYHMVSDKYVAAVHTGADAMPLLLPALGEPPAELLQRIDGLFLTGSPSNVEPHHYEGAPPPDADKIDPARDSTTLPLIRAAIAAGLPILAVCRGMQELNVALGGTLHQEVHSVPGRFDHRSPEVGPQEHQYRKVHGVALTEGSCFAALAGATEVQVNSLHGQGLDRLADNLVAEGFAPDGQVEAVRLKGAEFVLAVQWHPEWSLVDDRFSRALFEAFGQACRQYAAKRRKLDFAA